MPSKVANDVPLNDAQPEPTNQEQKQSSITTSLQAWGVLKMLLIGAWGHVSVGTNGESYRAISVTRYQT
jgi:hypothetical protein